MSKLVWSKIIGQKSFTLWSSLISLMLKGLVRTTTCTLFAVASSHSRLLAFSLSRNKGYQNLLGWAYYTQLLFGFLVQCHFSRQKVKRRKLDFSITKPCRSWLKPRFLIKRVYNIVPSPLHITRTTMLYALFLEVQTFLLYYCSEREMWRFLEKRKRVLTSNST